jgi:hypothetical protein
MNAKLLLGIVLFVIGLATALVGIAGVGRGDVDSTAAVVVEDDRSQNLSESMGQMAVPLIAGLSLAIGGLLIGLSVGNWKNPRTNLKPGDEVVNPEGYHKMKHV